jgi:hypothetical protein
VGAILLVVVVVVLVKTVAQPPVATVVKAVTVSHRVSRGQVLLAVVAVVVLDGTVLE